MSQNNNYDLANMRLSVGAAYLARKYEKAIELAEEGLHVYPNDKRLLSLIVDAYINIKQYETAFHHAKKLITVSPDDPSAICLYADVVAGTGNYMAALEYTTHAIEIAPEKLMGYETRANIYRHMGRVDLAIEDLNSAIERHNDTHAPIVIAGHHFSRAVCYMSMDKYDEARTDFKVALTLNPSDSFVLLAYCWVCSAQNRLDLCRDAYKEYRENGGELDLSTRG